ncbi:AgmX/PglI C-terminal domain-containing protein [Fibrobacter sp. UBA4297]|uniref:AgmX/PglI C-terminal domain-containing protein n=1 Tax=Fibrobacter sp. UBA4297 TaxID=1946536 RepID=UPI0025BECBAB|nr:AgmX/PglI C-terminal domain-containing protein [Fibrobacter sp. UBA4297]
MKIFKMKNFFIAIVVASVAFVLSGCKEEKRVTESSHLTETKELATSQKNEKPICCFKDDYNVVESNDNVAHQRNLKNDSSSAGLDSSWYRRGKPIPSFDEKNEASRDRIRRSKGIAIDFEQQNPIVMNYPSCVQFGVRCASRGSVKIPPVREIDFKYEKNGSRTASDIMKTIRLRTPGLRHIYRKHLKKMPGFQGQITLKFTIISSGEISDISIVSSTTQNREFDTGIQQYVSRWMFHKIKSGKTTVTIPLIFTE